MLIIRDGIELDMPLYDHEAGPSEPLVIDDALSRARAMYINGASAEIVLGMYETRLNELQGWRSYDAAGFLAMLRALVERGRRAGIPTTP